MTNLQDKLKEKEKICYYSAQFGASRINSEFLCKCDELECKDINKCEREE